MSANKFASVIATLVHTLLLHCDLQPILDDISYCDSNGVYCPSLYNQYCCNESNRGHSFILTGQQNIKYFLCPVEKPSSCSSITSCSNILKYSPSAASGYYNITLANGTTVTVYCDMEGVNCDGEGGWTRVAYLNMSNPKEQCPPGFSMLEKKGIRVCSRQTTGCQSVIFPTYNISYSQVCGRVIGYQQGSTDGLHPWRKSSKNINNAYVDGVSITRGSPRKHIWTFIAALQENFFLGAGQHGCPCAPGNPVTTQPFVGDDYFCESGNPVAWNKKTFYKSDPLWDGEQCGLIEKECCNMAGIPWFNKVLEQSTTDYIELRLCVDESISNEDIPVDLYQIFIK